ncbi:MAG: glycosyltransferase [Paracoccaceae bacterium]
MTGRAIRNILFITWDGPETRYLERLFLPILAGLAEGGWRFHVLQFGWGDEAVFEARAAACRAAGIPYRRAGVWRRGGGAGALLSALVGARAIRAAVADWGIDTLMPRSLMPALAVLRMGAAGRRGLRLIYDADGLTADERVDFGGLSPHGLTYRLLRDVEGEILRRADAVLMRTAAARAILLARAGGALAPGRCHLVRNGVDPAPFRAALDGARDGAEGFTLVYSGSIGVQYRLPEMLDVAQALRGRIPDLRLRLLSPAQGAIRAALAERGLAGAGWITTESLAPDAVPAALCGCDLALALRQPAFSTQAVLPIKLGEYLLAGVPVIGTPGVGNTEELEAEGVFRSAEAAEREAMIGWVLDEVLPRREEMRARCHAAGLRHFSLAATVESYARALRAVAEVAQ